ncbi:MAG: hypothetical protein KF798_06455 [Candidatus Paracaedibacteraceae bacterium]|nr:hypothetical protein [Candidatus Paracaedibacteraceae bacterium]
MIKFFLKFISIGTSLYAYDFNQTSDARYNIPPEYRAMMGYITDQDVDGFTQVIEHYQCNLNRRLWKAIYDKVVSSEHIDLFDTLNHHVRYSDSRLLRTLDETNNPIRYIRYAKVIIREIPHLLAPILFSTLDKDDTLPFMFILNNYANSIDEDMAFTFFFITLKHGKTSYTEKLIDKLRLHTQKLCNEIYILASYFQATKIAQHILATYPIHDDAICTIYANIQNMLIIDKPSKEFTKRVKKILQDNTFTQAPQFKAIKTIKFLNLHNALLFDQNCFYRIRFHLTVLPFMPPYTIAFDDDELECTIDLNNLYISTPEPMIGRSFIYQANNPDPDLYEKAHTLSYAKLSEDDHPIITVFVELIPTENISNNPLPSIWQLNSDRSDFILSHPDERFQACSSAVMPPE